jgi:hypothetical protein
MVVLAIILLLGFGRKIRPRKGPPTHPVPATGPIETSRRPKNTEEVPIS